MVVDWGSLIQSPQRRGQTALKDVSAQSKDAFNSPHVKGSALMHNGGVCVGMAEGKLVGAAVGDAEHAVNSAALVGVRRRSVCPPVMFTVKRGDVPKVMLFAASSRLVNGTLGLKQMLTTMDPEKRLAELTSCSFASRDWSIPATVPLLMARCCSRLNSTKSTPSYTTDTPRSCPSADGLRLGFELGVVVGAVDGISVGFVVGRFEGSWVGDAVGRAVGAPDGLPVGNAVGCSVGDSDGSELGATDGNALGMAVGRLEGAIVGSVVGRSDGIPVGVAVGDDVGTELGRAEGTAVGFDDGVAEGV